MNLTEKYKTYRSVGRELNNKIAATYAKRRVLLKSAKLLGIVKRGVLVFDSEDEMDVLMDFALNEYRVNNQNAVELYRRQTGLENEIEEEILDALVSSYTSLFKITSVSKRQHLLVLSDLLNRREDIELIDIGFSRTAIPGLLLFLRVVHCKDFNMSSGIAFVFPGDLEDYLLGRYKRLRGRAKSRQNSIKRFVSFYKLSKTDGIEVRYE